jgi:CO/xanthine dehydrogenase Mo-binding subunit
MKEAEPGAVIGRPHARVEGFEKVTGRAMYACDVRLPGQLFARVLRSPHAHARVLEVDASRAERHAGVHAVLTGASAGDVSWYEGSRLFDDTVRFAGEEVAAVAAESEDIAEDALRLIEVRYEPLEHRAGLEAGARGEAEVQGRGDVEAGFAAAEVVIDETYATQTALHHCMEPHGCVAFWEAERLTLYESTQGIFSVREEIAARLGMAEENVRVVKQHMGGGFGSKQIAWKHSAIAALLAKRAGRPVQLVLDRTAESLAVGNRNATRQRVRLGARRDGRLTAIDVHIEVDTGAYLAGGEASDVMGTYQTLYSCPNVRAEQLPVRTNAGPAVAFRAPGHAEASFALESAMDELARRLGIDPIALRLLNYAERDQLKDRPYTAPESLRRCYESVAQAFGWGRPRGPRALGAKRRGVGFAAHDWAGGSGHPPAEALVRWHADGAVEVITGSQDIGTGTRTALCQVAAEALGVPLERVACRLGDTAAGLYAPVSAGSATLATLGPAVHAAAQAAKRKRERQRSPRTVEGRGKRAANRRDRSIRTCGAQCAEVEVDTQTGDITVLRVAAAHDCGRIVNPLLVESQVAGGIVQALGYALSEARVVDRVSGIVLNPNLEEYKLPTAADMPEIENATRSLADDEANSLGAKGIGEPPIIPTAAAIANAVYDAVGVRLRELPLRRERLLER